MTSPVDAWPWPVRFSSVSSGVRESLGGRYGVRAGAGSGVRARPWVGGRHRRMRRGGGAGGAAAPPPNSGKQWVKFGQSKKKNSARESYKLTPLEC